MVTRSKELDASAQHRRLRRLSLACVRFADIRGRRAPNGDLRERADSRTLCSRAQGTNQCGRTRVLRAPLVDARAPTSAQDRPMPPGQRAPAAVVLLVSGRWERADAEPLPEIARRDSSRRVLPIVIRGARITPGLITVM